MSSTELIKSNHEQIIPALSIECELTLMDVFLSN
jgi:hypothetical protein